MPAMPDKGGMGGMGGMYCHALAQPRSLCWTKPPTTPRCRGLYGIGEGRGTEW